MYYLDGRWRRQSLVYFGEPQDSSANVAGGAFREARGYVPGPIPVKFWSRRTTRMNCEFERCFLFIEADLGIGRWLGGTSLFLACVPA